MAVIVAENIDGKLDAVAQDIKDIKVISPSTQRDS
jgi:hypothetical protein